MSFPTDSQRAIFEADAVADPDAGQVEMPPAAWVDRTIERAVGHRQRLQALQADARRWAGLRQAVARLARDKDRALRAPALSGPQAVQALFGWASRLDDERRQALDCLAGAMIDAAQVPAWPGFGQGDSGEGRAVVPSHPLDLR